MDRQYWAPDDAQKHPYDDTGWNFPALFNVKVTRVVDVAVLRAKMTMVEDPAAAVGKVAGAGGVYVVANTGQSGLLGLVYGLKGAGQVQVVEKEFAGAGGSEGAGGFFGGNRGRGRGDGGGAEAGGAGCGADGCDA